MEEQKETLIFDYSHTLRKMDELLIFLWECIESPGTYSYASLCEKVNKVLIIFNNRNSEFVYTHFGEDIEFLKKIMHCIDILITTLGYDDANLVGNLIRIRTNFYAIVNPIEGV